MFNPFQSIESLGWALLWTLLLAAGYLALFTRQRAGWVVLGWFRALLSLVSAPIQYLARILHRFGQYGEQGEAALGRHRQGLWDAFLAYVQAGVAALCILGLGAATVNAWKTLMPSEGATAAAEATQKRLKDVQAESAEVQARLDAFKGGLEAKRGTLVADYKSARVAAIAAAKETMSARERAATSAPQSQGLMNEVKTFLDKPEHQSGYAIQNAKRAIENHLTYRVSLPAELTQPVREYNDAWATKAIAEEELRNFNEAQVVRVLEAERRDLEGRVQGLTREVAAAAREYAEADARASLRFALCFGSLLTSFVSLLGFLWAAGLLLELADLALGCAAHLKELRDQAVRTPRCDGNVDDTPAAEVTL